jgi:hypothetical protein
MLSNTRPCGVIQNSSATNDRAENSICGMVSANEFDCHSPAPVQKPVQVQGSTSKEYGEDGGAVSRNWECGRQEKRREQATYSHARPCWDHSCECGLISSTDVCVTASENEVSPSTAWRILRTDLRRHPYKIHVLQFLKTVCRGKVDKICGGIQWSLSAEPSHSGTHLVLNPCDYFLGGYLEDKVFSSAPWTLPELKESVKVSCAQVTRGMLTRVAQNFVLRLQAVWEYQGAHIEHVIHNAAHMWNSNPCLLLWHCFHKNKFAIANALLS